jgi:hypothetical protein
MVPATLPYIALGTPFAKSYYIVLDRDFDRVGLGKYGI